MIKLISVAILLTLQLVLGQEFQCSLEKIDSGVQCVFRGVNLGKNSAGARFIYPTEIAKPSQVAFVESSMKQLPFGFLTLAGPELKVLRVESCGLESVTVPGGLEELYAKGNSIEKVMVPQSDSGGSLRMLDLSGNELSGLGNVTRYRTLEVLNLSGNKLGEVLDLGKFKGLDKLRMLNLSHAEINYLDNTGNVNLDSLEDLDLSHNYILPSDLNIGIFYPFTKLHTLRLNNNLMAQLDYNHLLNMKALKTVYLNGNNFKCDYLNGMLKHLQQNNLQTPPGELTPCPEKTFEGFCCTGPLPTKPILPRTTKPTSTTVDATEPQTRTTRNQPTIPPPVNGEDHEEGESWASWIWITVGAGTVVGVIAIILGVLVLKNQSKADGNYWMTPGNVELS